MDEREQGILDWIRTFESVEQCSSLNDLCTGKIIGNMLIEIAPQYFDLGITEDSSGNWILSASNLKKILRALDEYYKNVLQKGIDMSAVDANLIARSHDRQHLNDLLELVVGVAVLCEDKNLFIQNIFSLDDASQSILKDMVEHVMRKTYDLEVAEDEADVGTTDVGVEGHQDIGQLTSELNSAHLALRRIEEEKKLLLSSNDDLHKANSILRQELEVLKDKEFLRDVNKDSDRSRAQAVATLQSDMQEEINDLKEKLTHHTHEMDKLKKDNGDLMAKLGESEVHRAQLEMEVVQQADAIDSAKEKADKLEKAENQIQKYQKKLETLSAIKNHNKELEEVVDKYMEQVIELEKSVATSQKAFEQQKNKNIELDRELFEAASDRDAKSDQNMKLSQELENALEAKNFLSEELESARKELERLNDQDAEADTGGGVGMFETPGVLKEKVRKLEMELRVMKDASQSGSGGASSQEDVATIALLKEQLEDATRIRKDREDTVRTLKKQLAELQSAQQIAARTVHEVDNSAEVQQLRQMLETKAASVLHMENKLKESESKIHKLEQDKEKLETFAKRSLTNFKEKYMTGLEKYKIEKLAMAAKLQRLEEKLEKDQDIFRREERLLLSSMYEIGVQVMDRNIMLQIQENSSTPNTFLASQRAEQDRRQSGSSGSYGTPTTPQR